MPYFGTRILTNLGVAPLKEFHLQMLIRVFKEVARPTLCREKIGKSWHETVVLAALGQFFRELVEGWIPSTITWSRAVYGHGTTIFSSSKVTVSSTVDLADYQTSFCCETSYCQDFLYLDILYRGKDVSPVSHLSSTTSAHFALLHNALPRSLHSIVFTHTLQQKHLRFSATRHICATQSAFWHFAFWHGCSPASLSSSTTSAHFALLHNVLPRSLHSVALCSR